MDEDGDPYAGSADAAQSEAHGTVTLSTSQAQDAETNMTDSDHSFQTSSTITSAEQIMWSNHVVDQEDQSNGLVTEDGDEIEAILRDATSLTDLNPLPPGMVNIIDAAEGLIELTKDNWDLLVAEHNCQDAVFARCSQRGGFNDALWNTFIVRLHNMHTSIRVGCCGACMTMLRPVYEWLHHSDQAAHLGTSYLTLAQSLRNRILATVPQVLEIRDRLKSYEVPNKAMLRANEEMTASMSRHLDSARVPNMPAPLFEVSHTVSEEQKPQLMKPGVHLQPAVNSNLNTAAANQGSKGQQMAHVDHNTKSAPDPTCDPMTTDWQEMINWEG